MRKKFFSVIFLFLLVYIFITPKVSAINLSDVSSIVSGNITYTGNENNLVINSKDGIYTVKASSFNCSPGSTSTCEPDRYEIRFNNIVKPIYGLGRIDGANTIEVSDVLDSSFGRGHMVVPELGLDYWESDNGRMRTPVLVFPKEKMIIAYLQPEIKIIRISRNGQYGCPSNNTCITLKKHPLYSEGQPATLLIVKGSSIIDTYKKYYHYLKDTAGFFFKKPHFQAFGNNWETYMEFGCNTSKAGVEDAVNRYLAEGIKLSTVTIGSGYWGSVFGNSMGYTGCTTPDSDLPVTDSLVANTNMFGGLSGLNQLFSFLENHEIYPMIGMRHQIRRGNIQNDNFLRINNLFSAKGVTGNIYINNNLYSLTNGENKGRFLNTSNESVIGAWLDLVRENYGNIKGFKEDDMHFSDQINSDPLKTIGRGKGPDQQATNLPDNLICKAFEYYSKKTNNDFVVVGDSSWFGVNDDFQSIIGWQRQAWRSNYPGYYYKDHLDVTLSQIVSGYPHPKLELSGAMNLGFGTLVPIDKQKEFARLHQLGTFLPAMLHSRGFWHVCAENDQACVQPNVHRETIIFYAKLRTRLQQYVYDQAQKWYEEGVPYAMQPLFFRFPQDEESYRQYQAPRNNSSPKDTPVNEYMFGNALLVRPILSNDDNFKVYFPEGKWRPFMQTGQATIIGPTTKTYVISSNLDFPVFLKEGEILVIGEQNNPNKLLAYVFLEDMSESSVYNLFLKNGDKKQLKAYKENDLFIIKNINNNKTITATNDLFNKGFKIADISTIIQNDVSGDINSDGKVNIFDYNILIRDFHKKGIAGFIPSDLKPDGKIDIFDFNILIANYISQR